MTQNMI